MKRFVSLLVMVVGVCACGSAANTFSNDPRFTDERLKAIEQNLQLALENGNFGMQASAAQVVREVKMLVPEYEFHSLVIPLMRIAKDERIQPAGRVNATLALRALLETPHTSAR